MPNTNKPRKNRSKKKSSIKKTWEKFVQSTDSRNLLKEAWKVTKDDQSIKDKINKFYKKFKE